MSFRLEPVANFAEHNSETLERIMGDIKGSKFADLSEEITAQIKDLMSGKGRGVVTENLTGRPQRLLSLSEADEAAKSFGLQTTIVHTKDGPTPYQLPIIGVANHDHETGEITSIALQPIAGRSQTDMIFSSPAIKWPEGTEPALNFSAKQLELNREGRVIAFDPDGVFALPSSWGRTRTVSMNLDGSPFKSPLASMSAHRVELF